MEEQHIEIAKDFSGEVRKLYPEIDITSIRFVGITEKGEVEVSAMPYHLDDAKFAMVICEYDYAFHQSYNSDFFVLFIDDKGKASNRLKMGEWTMKFDEPVTGGRRSHSRHCYMGNNQLQIDINCTDCDIIEHIGYLWELFHWMQNETQVNHIKNDIAPYTIGNTVYLYKYVREKH